MYNKDIDYMREKIEKLSKEIWIFFYRMHNKNRNNLQRDDTRADKN
ncbi:hypothetical protein P5008_05500 [Helcococcus ovis]